VAFNGDRDWLEQALTIALPSNKLKIKAGVASTSRRK
jgi:hypothetical protein